MAAKSSSNVIVELLETQEDAMQAFNCAAEAFGTQAHDTLWMAMNPAWDTPEGRAQGGRRLVREWQKSLSDTDINGRPKILFIKGTLPHPDDPTGKKRAIAGYAKWTQYSIVEGHGIIPSTDFTKYLLEVYPDDKDANERRFVGQMMASFLKRRTELISGKASDGSNPPAVLVLDLCAVHPDFQRRGVANALVKRGIEEGRSRGDLELALEGSRMGRGLYAKLGFWSEGDIEYVVDEEFRDREGPSNVFMRTKGKV